MAYLSFMQRKLLRILSKELKFVNTALTIFISVSHCAKKDIPCM